MTTDNLLATLIDESCFSDIFTMQSQTLDDFEFGLEATNIDSLLELFEEREKRNINTNLNSATLTNNFGNNISKANAGLTLKRETNSIIITSPKVRKSSINSSTEISSKRKGTSLLAKPKKSNSRRNLININECELQSFSSCFPQDHDYCLISDEHQLFNKLPDYITTFQKESDIKESSDTFDKIPDYIKGFLNLNNDLKDITINEEDFIANNDDILIELNEAYIEVSDVFFDEKMISNEENKTEDYSANDSNDCNSMSDISNFSSLITSESEDNKTLKEIMNNEHKLPQDIEQRDNKSNNINNNNADKQITGKSRSRSREPRSKAYANSTTRRRRLSTRSSVDSLSHSSRSSSRSSCSSCSSFSSGSSSESKINYKHSNSIIRNDNNKGQQFTRKRTLKESYCQNNNQRSKMRPNYGIKNCNEMNNINNGRNCIKQSMNMKKDIEERKIIYVGKIPDGTTKTDIRHWFGRFGAIKEVSIHFRDYGDNYAFVTFFRRCDAYEAIEHANEDSRHPKFDLSFGGRRQFCKTRYEDLDYAEDNSSFSSDRMDFDALLRSTQAKLNR